jgi:diguanylate cyclase (GGDEF)-like protein/PAS domain S-box-containing protein
MRTRLTALSLDRGWASRARRFVKRPDYTLLWPLGFAATLAVSAALALGLIDKLEAEQVAVLHSARVERELQHLLRLTVDVETATRGFVIAHDPVFLAPATHALPQIDAALDELRTLAADSAAVAGSVRDLERAVVLRVAHARAEQADAQAGKPVGIDGMLASKDLQDRIRTVVARVGAQESALRERSMERSAQARIALKTAIALSTLVLGALGWMWFRARRRLQRTQDNYRHLFSIAADGMALVGADGCILQVNASYADMLGYSEWELIGMDFTLLKHPAERAHAREALQTLLGDDPQVLRNERRYLRKDGSEVWVRSTMSRTRRTADGSAQLLAIAEDVSERIHNEELLRRSSVLLSNAGRMAAIDGWFLAFPGGPLHVGAHLKRLLSLDDDRPAALLARLTAPSRTVLLRALSRCRRKGSAFDIELEADSASAPIMLRVMGQPAFGPHGLAGIDGAVQDITEQKRAQRSLLKSERRFRAAAQVTNDGIWDWDVAAGAIWRSPSIAALVGLDRDALDGSPAAWQHLIHPDDRAAVGASVASVLEGAADEFQATYRVLRADGSHTYVLDKACALRDDSGAVVRMVGGIVDLTERRRSQQALMGMAASVPDGDSEAFFLTLLTHLMAAIGADGGAIARPVAQDPAQMTTVAALVDGKPLGRLDYALAGSPCARFDLVDEYVMPDGLSAACPDARGLPGVQARAYAGHRLVATDGRPLGVIFTVFRNPIADQEGMTAVLRVFAARAGAELERMDGAARMREQAALLDEAREAIVVLGLDLVVKFWNRGAELMYGILPQQSMGNPVLFCYEEAQTARAALAAVLECGEWRGESVQRRGDGSILTVDESWTLVRDDQGAPHSILKVGSDVTDKRAAEEHIRRLAYYDALTGLPNRRLLMDRLRQLILRNGRQRRHGALLFIDMDNFKTLNDTHGHDAGDEFLRQTAARLRACVRAEDTVGRLGGDEFVILLDSLDPVAQVASRQARAVGASVVNAFRLPVRIGAIEHRSTASVGIVLVPGGDADADALLRRADQAMYQAKNGGRNAVVMADEIDHAQQMVLLDAARRAELAP